MPLLMFAIVFAWTPPHFWSLSLWAHGDYERAGVPMLPVVAGARETRRQILLYTVLLVALSSVALGARVWRVRSTGSRRACWAPASSTAPGGCCATAQDARGVSLTGDAPARAAFSFSILYLFVLFGALAVDRFLG